MTWQEALQDYFTNLQPPQQQWLQENVLLDALENFRSEVKLKLMRKIAALLLIDHTESPVVVQVRGVT
jgi:hypothetical protein